MKAIQLRPYQIEAINAIQGALTRKQKYMIVEMVAQSGKGLVLAKTVEILQKQKTASVLVITNGRALKENIEHNLFETYQTFLLIDKDRITVTTKQRILHYENEKLNKYQYVIFDEIDLSETVYKMLDCKEKTVIVFDEKYANNSFMPFETENVIFSYSYKDAVIDGFLTPAMDTRALEPAVEAFSKQLLEQFGCTQINIKERDSRWDLVVSKSNQRIWVECKAYKSQVVSPSTANSLLSTIVMRKMKQDISKTDIVLLIVLSRIPSFQKDEIYNRYQIVVWDIENLVFYSKNNMSLLKQLSQITYFPIDSIEGRPSIEADLARLVLISAEDKNVLEVEKENDEISKLIQRLNNCKSGKKHSSEYEEICEKILRNLFEANYFNKLRNQYKTKDEHFRMDLIGSLKINQNNEENMHPLWQMLVQHYNSHFVVFEFKNYSKEIDQNLIYITEKYLFDAALRNVAIIISRKGFSKSAKFAAEGCLKEHGKLILDITDNDLIKMLELKSDKAADYILDKLEEFLMGISK